MEDRTDGDRSDWSELHGKKLKVVYQDGQSPQGSPHFSSKEGTLIFATDTHIILEQEITGKEIGILKTKILRFEVL